jgi:hypothetical protein
VVRLAVTLLTGVRRVDAVAADRPPSTIVLAAVVEWTAVALLAGVYDAVLFTAETFEDGERDVRCGEMQGHGQHNQEGDGGRHGRSSCPVKAAAMSEWAVL